MIPVPHPIPEPDGFDEQCRQKGSTWLQNNPDCKRPKDFWSPFRHALAEGFSHRCGYGAMWISNGTVDHFISVHSDKALAYDWQNFRYIEGWINSSKNKRKESDILDPFEVENGWFEILLPSLQLIVSDTVSNTHRQRAENTLECLHLRDDERIIRQRREWYRMYQEGELSLDGLRRKAPLIAAAIDKQNENAAATQEL
jgi:hypothetical protein